MAQSLVQKFSLLWRAGAHEVADEALQQKAVAALNVQIGDLEHEMTGMRESEAQAVATVTGLRRELDTLQSRVLKLEGGIKAILTDDDPNNDVSAKALALQLAPLKRTLEDKQSSYDDAVNHRNGVRTSVEQVQARHTDLLQQRDELAAMVRATQARNQAATTMERAKELTAVGANTTVDNVVARQRRESDVAKARFDMAMAGLNQSTDDATASAEADALLANIKAGL